MVSKVRNCPYCKKTINLSEPFCSHCLWELPQNEEEYDFDFSKRQVELISINEKWISYPTSEAAKNQLSVLSLSLRDFVFELIDEGIRQEKKR